MPKEITYTSQPVFVRDDDGNEHYRIGDVKPLNEPLGPALRRALVVGWSRETGHVEIGMDELLIATEHGTHDRGMYASFDRAGLNRVIRSLRKARDQAFGPDA